LFKASNLDKGDDFSTRFSSVSGLLIHATNLMLENCIVYLEQQPAQSFYTTVFELQAQGIIGIVYATPASTFKFKLIFGNLIIP
jgi:hypothetical protein